MSVNMNSQANGITIVGLGPGDPAHLTLQAWQWLNQVDEVYLRTKLHPVVAGFPSTLQVHSFDDLYEHGQSFEAVYQEIVAQILRLGARPQGVTYAVPGHPYVAEFTAPEIVRQAKAAGIPVRVVEGMSFLDPTFTALQLDPFPRMTLIDALELGALHTPNFPPDTPVLITQIYNRMTASGVKLTLNAVYPDSHPVRLVHGAGTENELIEELPLYEIDRSPHIGLLTALYVPPLERDGSLESFQEVVARLRAPDGCPWDREQTHLSLRKYLIEETYEAIDALDAEDPQALCEELGDIFLQIALHAQIGAEDGEFGMADVLAGINRKIVRRHPHVFGDADVAGVEGVLTNWQKLKQAEKEANGNGQLGILSGVPKSMPSLARAEEIQMRAARVGFDWPTVEPVYAKIQEEIGEVLSAPNPAEREKELGDLLFSVVNLVRWYRVDPEAALRGTNDRFMGRFAYIEQQARKMGRELTSMSLEEMDALWVEAKHLQNGHNLE
jgi:tetrapyrrole methylase family protein/MazG family protein